MKKFFYIIGNEFAQNGLGWIVGFITAKLLSQFFTVKSWTNGWGLFTSRTAVNEQTYGVIEFVAQVVVGFIFFSLVNYAVKKMRKSE